MLVTKNDLRVKYVKFIRLYRRLMFSPYLWSCAQVLVSRKVSVLNPFFKY